MTKELKIATLVISSTTYPAVRNMKMQKKIYLNNNKNSKNIFDWISRIDKIVWWNKPMLLLSTSDGIRGAVSVLEMAHQRISFEHKFNIPTFSLPSFSKNFNDLEGILNSDLKKSFLEACEKFKLNL